MGLLAAIFRIKGRGLHFQQFRFFCKGTPSQYKKIIEPPKNRAGYNVQWLTYIEDALILDEEKAIKKLLSLNKETKPIARIIFYLRSQLAG